MGLQKILYDHLKEYTETINNAVGPSTSLTLRTLENATPNDTNTIYCAPINGSDAAAGTAAAPVKTLEVAIDKFQAGSPTVTTIQVIRNSGVGLLALTTSADHWNGDLIPTNGIFQVELGETATITFQDGGGWLCNGIKINGFYLKFEDTPVGSEWLISNTSAARINWCKFSYVNNNTTAKFEVWGDSGDVNNTIFDGTGGTTNLVIWGDNYNYCIFKNFLNSVSPFLSVGGSGANFDHCLFYNNNILFSVGAVTAAITNSIFYKNSSYVTTISTSGVLDIDYGLSDLSDEGSYDGVITLGSNMIYHIDPLFLNEDTEDFRLMDQRKIADDSDQYFVISSQAVYNTDLDQTPSDDAKDLGPFDVSYSLDTDTWETLEFDNEAWNEALDVPFELINYQNFNDIRGNFHRSFDGEWGKRTMLLKRTSNTYCGTDDSADLLDVFQSDSAKRFYPFGDDGIFQSSGTLTLRDDGDYDVSLASIAYLKRKFYRGFICSTSSGAVDYDLQIRDNTSGALVLHDHRGNQSGVTASDYLITCLYLPVEIDMSTMQLKFMNWDPQANPWNPDFDPTAIEGYEQVDITTPQSWEANIHELTLKETEDDE